MRRITEVYLFVNDDVDHEEEGILAFLDRATNAWMPMVVTTRERARLMLPTAQTLARAAGRPLRILRFSARVELDEAEL